MSICSSPDPISRASRIKSWRRLRRIRPTKGLQILLPAVADLIAAGRHINVVLIGKPKQGGDTEQLIRRLELEPHIRWYHDLEQERIVDLYAESTLAVVPSLYEGFGLPAVEAMACGITAHLQ